MRIAIVAALVAAAAVAAFLLGRLTADDAADSITGRTPTEFVAQVGDTMRVPSIGVYCGVDVEARRTRLHCTRLAQAPSYDVSLERKRTVVGRVGDPGRTQVFPER
jgi:hypothetical protein